MRFGSAPRDTTRLEPLTPQIEAWRLPTAIALSLLVVFYPLAALGAPGGYEKDWWNKTTLDPPGLVALIVLSLATLALPRKHFTLPLFIMACFVSVSQRVAIFTLDFHLLRFLVLMGWLRLLLRRETRPLKWQKLDTAIFIWAFCSTVFFTLRNAKFGALVNRAGLTFDAVGTYFLFRQAIRSWRDLDRIFLYVSSLSIPVSVIFVYEWISGYNLFSVFGGVREWTQLRDGRLRCQGPFPHPIIAGAFWSTLIPAMVVRFFRRGIAPKILAVTSVVCVLILVVTTASSTPLITVMAAFGAIGLYPLRKKLPLIRWSVIAVLTIIHFAGNKPVWHLMARMNMVGGSTGYYRYKLLNSFIYGWKSWVPIGLNNTAIWGKRMTDITNQFVLEGVRGGLATLLAFIYMLFRSYQGLGRALRATEGKKVQQYYVWAVGACMFAHCCTFFATSYFGQIKLVWYLTLACTASVAAVTQTAPSRKRKKRRRVMEEVSPAEAEAATAA